MRKIIAALQVSLDGYIEGPRGELDWVEAWEDPFDLLPQIDTCILGGGMYPGYERYWLAILENPGAVLPMTGKVASPGELAYAKFADKTPHIVLSKTLGKVAWHTTQVVREVEDIQKIKQQPGKDIHAVGGATFVSSLLNYGLLDEFRLVVQPIVLGGGKALFKDVRARHALNFQRMDSLPAGQIRLTYTIHPPAP